MKNKIIISIIFVFTILFLSCEVELNMPLKLSSENKILSFTINKDGYSKNFNISENLITGKVENSITLEDIILDLSISEKATISPDPSIITSINDDLTFVVTAENGNKRTYKISIEKELSNDNLILDFEINNPVLNIKADIKGEKITKRVPEFVDISNTNAIVSFSKLATITPNPESVTDYSNPVNFTVTSQSGIDRVYTVVIEHMDEDFSKSCSEINAWKWFGGDNRTNAPDIKPYNRNVGTGQAIKLDKDLYPTVFKINLDAEFRYDEGFTSYKKEVTLKLNIRNSSDTIIASTTTNVPSSFNGGFISFDIESFNLFFNANETYVFQWYLVDGAKLGVNSSSSGNNKNTGSGFCFGKSYFGESHVDKNTSLEDSENWYEHGWSFSIGLEGKE